VLAWRLTAPAPGPGIRCSAAGNCTAGGYYSDGPFRWQAFVVSEQGGTWGTASQVPGIRALNRGGKQDPAEADITSVSCASAGNCAAGGFYTNASGHQAFVVSEQGGIWGTAIEVPGTAARNIGHDAQITSVSCAPGGCAAGGWYASRSGGAFVVTEQGGKWEPAVQVRTGALSRGNGGSGYDQVNAVSCSAVGSCVAGGFFFARSRITGFLVTEHSGRWGPAIEIPGFAALNKGTDHDPITGIDAVSCGAAGSCAAGGVYTDGSGREQVFVVSEQGGQWGMAIEVPGFAALNKGLAKGRVGAGLSSVSCAVAAGCAAGGFYTDASGRQQAFVVSEQDERWGTAIEVPGTAGLNKGATQKAGAQISSVSCSAAGSCAAGGSYIDGLGRRQPLLVSERDGSWGAAVRVPGIAALNKGAGAFSGAAINSVSCAAGSCAAGGNLYRPGAQHSGVPCRPVAN
jgi:hypothetical protein